MINLRDLSELLKIKIAIASTFTGVASYIIRRGKIDGGAVLFFIGLLLLASGACALNQVQEREKDALMERTKKRPVASGRITPVNAISISLIAMLSGLLLLFFGDGAKVSLLGAGAVLCYNGVYTYLKRMTPWAPLPGAFVGVFPPLMGWLSAGGSIAEPALFIILSAVLVYQVPHFLLLYLNYEDDYRRAGFPLFTSYLSREYIKKLLFIWILSIVVLFLLFFQSGIIYTLFSAASLVLGSSIFIYFMSKLTRDKITLKQAFLGLNAYVVLVFLLPIIERIFNP